MPIRGASMPIREPPKMMNETEIHATLAGIEADMEAKGYRASVSLMMEATRPEASAHMRWCPAGQSLYGDGAKWESMSRLKIAEALSALEAFVAATPSVEENRKALFLENLCRVIDQGRAIGVETEILNPLVETMKRLSENILTDQRGGPEA